MIGIILEPTTIMKVKVAETIKQKDLTEEFIIVSKQTNKVLESLKNIRGDRK